MPDNPFRQANPFRVSGGNPFRTEPEGPPANAVAREMGARRFLDNAMALPSASGDLLAYGAAGADYLSPVSVLQRYRARMSGGTPPTFSEMAEQQKGQFPANMLRAIPRPTTKGISSAVQSIPSLMPGGETPGDAFDRNMTEEDVAEYEMRAAHPVAATVGDVAGDVGGLLATRRATGLSRLATKVEGRLMKLPPQAAESLAGDLNKAFTSKAMRTLARGAGRSLETGAEAAAMDIVNNPDADPVESAMVGAGGQMVGSGFMSAASGLLSGGPTQIGLKVSVAAAATLGIVQALKSATPGGEDRILESAETAWDKVLLTLGIGAASAAVGATRYGRGNAALSDQTRTFLDNIAGVHRGTTLSLLTQWRDSDPSQRAVIEKTLTAATQDPYFVGETELEKRIVRGLRGQHSTGGGF